MPFRDKAIALERYAGAIVLVLCALVVLIVGWSYPLGSIRQMGAGYFPRIIGFLMLGFGLLCLLSDIRYRPDPVGGMHWRNIGFVAVSVMAFAALIDKAGLVPATFVAVLLSQYADRMARPVDAVIYTLLVCLGAWLLFIQILGLPLAAFGRG